MGHRPLGTSPREGTPEQTIRGANFIRWLPKSARGTDAYVGYADYEEGEGKVSERNVVCEACGRVIATEEAEEGEGDRIIAECGMCDEDDDGEADDWE